MSEEKETGILGGVAKALNDARYVPALIGVVLIALALFGPEKNLAEESRRKLVAVFAIFTLSAAIIGFIHNQLAWRAVNAAKYQAAVGPSDKAPFTLISKRCLSMIVGAYVVIIIMSIILLVRWFQK